MLSIIKNWSFRNKKKYSLFSKLTSTLVLVSFWCANSSAQNNLVPNGSFETYITCPTSGYGEINKATPWFQPNYPYAGAGGSSDFLNFCTGYTCVDLFQCPRHGNGMAGAAFFFDTSYYNIDKWREYIEVGLIDSLIAGKKYCVRFYVNKSNNSGMSGFPIKQIQAVLTKDSLLYTSPNYVYISGVTPIVEADSIITDTVNWVPIETTYLAQGGEKFLTIGNFAPGNMVNYTVIGDPHASNNTLGYYLIDDVSIYQQPDVFAGNDTIIPPGDSVQLGITGRPDIFYSWSPTTGLNNPNIANPMATPSISTIYVLTVTDTNSLACTNVFKDTVNVQVGYAGINENNFIASFNVFPNPFSESVIFKTNVERNYEIKIFDVIGKQVDNRIFEGKEYNYENSELRSGIYFYEILYKNKSCSRGKLIKK